MGKYHGTRMSPRMTPNKRKVMLLLCAGVGLAFAGTPTQQYRIIRSVCAEWRAINQTSLRRAVRSLEHDKLIQRRKRKNGSIAITLTPEGRGVATRLKLEDMTLRKQKRWDQKWRVVMYDIPESARDFRLDFGRTLRRLGFVELQHSVLVYPYDCKKEIEQVVATYHARKFVRYATLDYITGEQDIKRRFGL